MHTHTKNHHQKKTQSHKMMREKEFWGEKKNTPPHLLFLRQMLFYSADVCYFLMAFKLVP